MEVLEQPALLAVLISGPSVGDPIIRMRAADAMEKASWVQPETMGRYEKQRIGLASDATQMESPCADAAEAAFSSSGKHRGD